jgi:hypothetical protein
VLAREVRVPRGGGKRGYQAISSGWLPRGRPRHGRVARVEEMGMGAGGSRSSTRLKEQLPQHGGYRTCSREIENENENEIDGQGRRTGRDKADDDGQHDGGGWSSEVEVEPVVSIR